MGKVMSSLFKEVAAMMIGITKGFSLLPTPSSDTDKYYQKQISCLDYFPCGEIPKIFNGKKITR